MLFYVSEFEKSNNDHKRLGGAGKYLDYISVTC